MTWFRDNGICMVADSTITNQNGNTSRVKQLKLLKHPNLNMGISWYGRGQYDNKSTSVWLNKIMKNTKHNSINEFASYLLSKLNTFNVKTNSGFHIGGYEKNGTPQFYHLTNCIEDNIINGKTNTIFKNQGEYKTEGGYYINGMAFSSKMIIEKFRKDTMFQNKISDTLDLINFTLFNKDKPRNLVLDNTAKGDLNKILLLLNIAQWFHYYSDEVDGIGGKFSTIIIHKTGYDYKKNGNIIEGIEIIAPEK